jgi:hypothetical protein
MQAPDPGEWDENPIVATLRELREDDERDTELKDAHLWQARQQRSERRSNHSRSPARNPWVYYRQVGVNIDRQGLARSSTVNVRPRASDERGRYRSREPTARMSKAEQRFWRGRSPSSSSISDGDGDGWTRQVRRPRESKSEEMFEMRQEQEGRLRIAGDDLFKAHGHHVGSLGDESAAPLLPGELEVEDPQVADMEGGQHPRANLPASPRVRTRLSAYLTSCRRIPGDVAAAGLAEVRSRPVGTIVLFAILGMLVYVVQRSR